MIHALGTVILSLSLISLIIDLWSAQFPVREFHFRVHGTYNIHIPEASMGSWFHCMGICIFSAQHGFTLKLAKVSIDDL